MRTVLLIIAGALLAAPAQARPLDPTPISDETYGETFTAIADLSDGTYVQVQLAVSNLGPGDGNGACRFLLIRPGQSPLTASDKVDRDEWGFNEKPQPTLRIGKCWAKAGAAVELYAPLDKGTVHLVLESAIASVKPPEHEIKVDGGFYQTELLVPWASAKANIDVGGKKVALTGYGYADHSRSTALPGKLAQRWVRFRGLSKDSKLLLVRFPDNGASRGWSWSEGDAAPTAIGQVKVAKKDITKNEPAWRIMVKTATEQWRITSHALLFRHAPVEEHGVLGSLVGRVVGNPVTYTHRATLEIRGKGKVEGILEVTLVGG